MKERAGYQAWGKASYNDSTLAVKKTYSKHKTQDFAAVWSVSGFINTYIQGFD